MPAVDPTQDRDARRAALAVSRAALEERRAARAAWVGAPTTHDPADIYAQ